MSRFHYTYENRADWNAHQFQDAHIIASEGMSAAEEYAEGLYRHDPSRNDFADAATREQRELITAHALVVLRRAQSIHDISKVMFSPKGQNHLYTASLSHDGHGTVPDGYDIWYENDVP